MAGGAAIADPGAPPAAAGSEEAPQLPYEAAPGTIMGFLISDMADINDSEMVRDFEASLKRYDNLPDTDDPDRTP